MRDVVKHFVICLTTVHTENDPKKRALFGRCHRINLCQPGVHDGIWQSHV